MGRVNPESKRGQVRLRFNAEGREAADALAASLGVPESKRRRWFAMWTGEPKAAPVYSNDPRLPDVTNQTSGAKVKRMRLDPANRVRWRGSKSSNSPHRYYGTLVARGPEQSCVVWDNGNEAFVVNEWIIGADEPDPEPKSVPRRRLRE